MKNLRLTKPAKNYHQDFSFVVEGDDFDLWVNHLGYRSQNVLTPEEMKQTSYSIHYNDPAKSGWYKIKCHTDFCKQLIQNIDWREEVNVLSTVRFTLSKPDMVKIYQKHYNIVYEKHAMDR